MFGWLKRAFFGSPKPAETTPQERTEITRDELMGMMLNHAFHTGEMVFANVGEDGKVHIETCKKD